MGGSDFLAVLRAKRGEQVIACANHKTLPLSFNGLPVFYLISLLGFKSFGEDWGQLPLLLQFSMPALFPS